ncbi:L-threonylcarbamoyladenylate synthase [Aestuariimicrobium sp. p3-SID1156]|uniref:L-threonylcarbamoyladenylate synthase n=1 Tax=Aestuariimicrobium sp. p3-SID1156 TaxID=2916038 RepID=UPI00223A7321|nr:L-threonylcarbamoyladenylate synthase [Aestuariimicrobium sp. p3-SID1156]MCT1458997.1 L-threonylcarbamoyladenylate synthase [Aestuariimicrobium sp. p3-SID1156]
MARYFDVHPDNPQPRALQQCVEILREGGLVAIPTDSGYALVCTLGNKDALERIRRIRNLDQHHHFTLLISEFVQVGQWIDMDNWVFRAIKANTPGHYTFIVKAGREVPKLMQHAKKKTVGLRIPTHTTTLALLDALGQPLVSTTLIMPGEEYPMSDGWQVKEELDHQVDAVLDSGDAGGVATTVVDLSGEEPDVLRKGAGDAEPFEA